MAEFDILIIGSGISGIATLKDTLSELITNKVYKTLAIGIVEQQEKLWNGLPFGSKISANCLTITSVVEFLTDADDKDAFVKWLIENKGRCLSSYLQQGGYTAQQWLEHNKELVELDEWDKLFIPRYWYREYITEILQQLIDIATATNAITLTTLNGEAVQVKQKASSYEVIIASGNEKKAVEATKLVLAIGSPPIKPLNINVSNPGFTYINDLYTRVASSAFDKLLTTLQSVEDDQKRNVLIVGSNASCTELLYLLSHDKTLLKALNRVVVLSSSGALPQAIDTADTPCPEFEHVLALSSREHFTCSELIAATLADIRLVNRNGVHTKNVGQLVTFTMQLKHRLTSEELQKFETNFGTIMTSSIRRMGHDYHRATSHLQSAGKLSLIKGKYVSLKGDDNDTILQYENEAGQLSAYDMPFAALVNCTGFEALNQCSSTLINNLVIQDLCKINSTGKGFEVNESFEANQNLYIMGPLLAGNNNKVIHFWHLENVARILYLAPLLRPHLLDEFKDNEAEKQGVLQSTEEIKKPVA